MEQLIQEALEKANARSHNGGVAPHSESRAYFIFCVGQDPVCIAAFISWAFNAGITFKPLIGKYNGVSERSFIANMCNYNEIYPFLKNEEAILVLNRYDARDIPRAKLVYRNGAEEELGKLLVVDKDTAMTYDSWTYDPLGKTYFVTS